ncbi:DUF6197 family protein [Streptomyces sp. NRRL F-5135]|uniref:DUF6197 family protein n=1 Tax=Streptomyces sp. NRRL F-5135 TaxID=1463858 RepID=UPI000AF7B797|nr:hypothetical protein [Streptomyces sp. NRRL F-5135]
MAQNQIVETGTPSASRILGRPHPVRPQPVRPTAVAPGPAVAPVPDMPPRSHRLLPRSLRTLMAGLGWWQEPVPRVPSAHLEQTIAVLNHYGWCKLSDFSPTGRMCIRGAQSLLEATGNVTPDSRDRAVRYMQDTLAEHGVTLPFYVWNDLPDQQFSNVRAFLTTAARKAHQNGE